MEQPVPDCLACAVRQLTEGVPEAWVAQEEGDSVSGVVLKTGHHSTPYSRAGTVPFVDLWQGGMNRIRVVGYGASLTVEFANQEVKVGDRVSVTYEGEIRISGGRYAGKPYRKFRVEVQRGHH